MLIVDFEVLEQSNSFPLFFTLVPLDFQIVEDFRNANGKKEPPYTLKALKY